MEFCLVLIETSGNQNYIYSTNKLRENIGASELTYLVGTKFLLQILGQLAVAEDIFSIDSDVFRKNLLDKNKNPSLENNENNKIEIILATSGKALLLVKNRNIGCKIVKKLTAYVLKNAPGIEVYGVVSKEFCWEKETIHSVEQQLHKEYNKVRSDLPSSEMRFLRLPIMTQCATSGLPATFYDFKKPNEGPRSIVALRKRDYSEKGFERMNNLAQSKNKDIKLAKSIEILEKKIENLQWLAVIHADGNGLGQIFLDFAKHVAKFNGKKELEAVDNRLYIDTLRRFSLALDVCTENAFCVALEKLNEKLIKKDSAKDISKEDKKDILPVVPIVVGGDDLTVLCDGKYAMQFTYDFLTEFEDQTKKTETDIECLKSIISEISEVAFKSKGLSSCAGISIVKPHFPFYSAYSLSEELLRSAKKVKNKFRHCSAIDFHILYDSSGPDLTRIRNSLKTDNNLTELVARPYIVTKFSNFEELNCWAKMRLWENLEKRVKAISATDENGKKKLPNSMLHNLREYLFLGKESADAQYKLVRNRYEDLKDLTSSEESLFWIEENTSITAFLDALDIVEFWEKDDDK